MTNAPVPAGPSACVERKPFRPRKGGVALAALAAATLLTGVAGRRSAHAALGFLLAGGLLVHVWKRRRAL